MLTAHLIYPHSPNVQRRQNAHNSCARDADKGQCKSVNNVRGHEDVAAIKKDQKSPGRLPKNTAYSGLESKTVTNDT